MRRLLPHPAPDVDLAAAYAVTAPAGRPHVVGMVVSSADGAAAVGGRSGALGGPRDHEVFHLVRAAVDAVVVGAGTVRDEDYGPVRLTADRRAARQAAGRAPTPRLVVVSGRLDLDPGRRLFAAGSDAPPPIVVHPTSAPAAARDALRDVAELEEVPPAAGGGVAAASVAEVLARRGLTTAVLEGGPTLAAAFVAEDLLDELCLTLDPRVVGGTAPRVVAGGGPEHLRPWRTVHLLSEGDVLFWRLARDRDGLA